MTDQNTYTAEHRSWQWELVMQFEEGGPTFILVEDPSGVPL